MDLYSPVLIALKLNRLFCECGGGREKRKRGKLVVLGAIIFRNDKREKLFPWQMTTMQRR
jgi:hypothetical protein